MFKYQALIKENLKEIAKLITFEQGKTIPDAEGDVMRGLQVNVVIIVVVILKIKCYGFVRHFNKMVYEL